MIDFFDVKNKVIEEFGEGNVFFSPADVPHGFEMPPQWSDFGVGKDSPCLFPSAWFSFSDKLPWVISLLSSCLLGTAIYKGHEPSLIYIFHDADDFYYYVGNLPLNGLRTTSAFDVFPESLKAFYNNVHNGFSFHPAQSMGPVRIENFSRLSELCDEDLTGCPDLLGFFQNGAGDYLSIDLENPSEDNGYIWWHESPLDPEANLNIWSIMDSWISIFLEDTRLRQDLI